MSKAILITGFNNWGKTTIIYELFQQRKRYYNGIPYKSSGINTKFIVKSQSNDDEGMDSFLSGLKSKYKNLSQYDLLAAFCPTREIANDSYKILTDQFFQSFETVYLFYIKNKWDYHAHLNISEIQNYYYGINNLKHIIIDSDNGLGGSIQDQQRSILKLNQIRSELKIIFP